MSGNLRRHERRPWRKIRVGEFDEQAQNDLRPFIFHGPHSKRATIAVKLSSVLELISGRGWPDGGDGPDIVTVVKPTDRPGPIHL
jgi:hypothetical protein